MKKKLLLVILLFITIFITGCTTKESLDASNFKKIMEKKSFNVVEQTSNVISQNKAVEISYNAESSDQRYSIEYYSFNSEISAQGFYAKKQAELAKTGSQAQTELNVGNYSKYTIIYNGKYTAISRVSNTIIYVTADNNYAEEIKTLLKEIGY